MNDINPYEEKALDLLAKEFTGALAPLKRWLFYTFTYRTELKFQMRKKDIEKTIDDYQPNSIEIKPIFSPESVKDFFSDIEIETQKIPEKQLQEPDKTLVGTIMNSSQYFVDDQKIRRMYAKLLAATVDSSKNNLVHRSFAKTLEELSPLEIDIIDRLFSEEFIVYCESLRIYNISFTQKNNLDVDSKNILEKERKFTYSISPIILFITPNRKCEIISRKDLDISLSILQKVGLIKPCALVSKTQNNVEVSEYQRFINNHAKKNIVVSRSEIKSSLIDYYELNDKNFNFAYEFDFSFFELTEYGKNLATIIL